MGEKQRYSFNAIALVSTISFQLSGSILLGVFIGRWLDQKFDTLPLFLLIGLLVGLSTGVYGVIHIIRRFQENDNDA